MSEEEWDRLCLDRKPPIDEQGYWAPRDAGEWDWWTLQKRLRLMRGVTQRQLAHGAKMVQSHVAKAESGADVRLSTVIRLIGALGCRLSLRVRPVRPFEVR